MAVLSLQKCDVLLGQILDYGKGHSFQKHSLSKEATRQKPQSTGMLVIACSTGVQDGRKLTMSRGAKDRLGAHALLIPECGI